MRARLVDVFLMVGLFLVGAAILWTLFTLGNDDRSRPDPADNPPAASAPAGDAGAGEVQALPPGDAATERGASAPESPPTDGAGSAGEDVTNGADRADGTTGTDVIGSDPDENAIAAQDEPTLPIVPGEPVGLQRVGFSFTTGGAGACGIVLEPWVHVAVSRDLLATYGCGAEITLELADETAGRTQVELVIADTMNEQFSRTANIYVAPDEPALAYGVTEGTLVP